MGSDIFRMKGLSNGLRVKVSLDVGKRIAKWPVGPGLYRPVRACSLLLRTERRSCAVEHEA